MLLEAAHMAEPKETIEEAKSNPTLFQYVESFGNNSTDIGFLLFTKSHKKIGAAWIGLLIVDSKGYSFIDNKTAELLWLSLKILEIVELDQNFSIS